MKIWNIGYPRIGRALEAVQAVQRFERGEIDSQALLEVGRQVLRQRWERQHELGVDSIPLNDFSFWDPLLDTGWLFNLVPQDTESEGDWLSQQKVLTSSKLKSQRWFNSSYHCFLPIWNAKVPLKMRTEKVDWEISCSKGLPYPFHFSLIGPWTLSRLCQTGNQAKSELLQELGTQYGRLLRELKKKGFEWVQLEEPSLCLELDRKDIEMVEKTYQVLSKGAPKILLSLTYDSPDPWLTDLASLPVQGFHFDIVSGPATLSWIKTRSFPKDKVLCLGLVNSRNIWASSISGLFKQIEILKGFHSEKKMMLAPGSSLAHLPLTVKDEKSFQTAGLVSCISFADERLGELAHLKKVQLGEVKIEKLEKDELNAKNILAQLQKKNESLRNQLNRLEPASKKRNSSCIKRLKMQAKKLALPKLPLTLTYLSTETDAISFQEQHHLDILLPGPHDPFFALESLSKLWAGFLPTENGWVQLQGSRCVRPPVLISDIEWKPSDSVPSFQKAQSQTTRLVKGLVLGPLSILNGSFVRLDQTQEQILLQAAFAVRKEIAALEEAGASIIQVDEPFFSEGFPLKSSRRNAVGKSLVDLCRLAVSGVKDETQLHLNIIGVPLEEIQEPLTKADVDVLYLSRTELNGTALGQIKKNGVEANVGLSLMNMPLQVVLSEKEFELRIRKAFEQIAPEKLWITPEVKNVKELEYVVQATLFIRRLLLGMK